MTDEQLYDEALQQMGRTPLELDETQPIRQKAWRNSQRYRRDRLRDAAVLLGFDTIDKLCKAIVSLDEMVIVKVRILISENMRGVQERKD